MFSVPGNSQDLRSLIFDSQIYRNGWPLDPRDKKLGDWTCLDMLQGVAAVTKLLERGGLPLEEIPAFLEQVRYDLTDATMRVYVVGKYK